MLPPSTGELRELSPQLKIKVNAVHAGLSQLSVPSKVTTSLPTTSSFHSLNNNSLIAQRTVVTLVAMVEIWVLPSIMLPNHPSKPSLTIHTRLKTRDVTTMPVKVLLELPTIKELPLTASANSRLPLTKVQSQSPLKPTLKSSNLTELVSSTPKLAELNSITVFSLLVMVKRETKNTISLRTHGALHGVRMDSSESPLLTEKVSVVSKCKQSTHSLLELDSSNQTLYFILKHSRY